MICYSDSWKLTDSVYFDLDRNIKFLKKFDFSDLKTEIFNQKNNLQLLQQQKCISEHYEKICFVFIAHIHF